MCNSALRKLAWLAAVACVVCAAGCSKPKTNIRAAAGHGDLATVKAYLDQGGDVNATNGAGTMLYSAAMGNQKPMARLLIANGADVNIGNVRNGETPLDAAAEFGNKGMAYLLIASGARIRLLDAVALNNTRMLERLIAKGANVNAADRSGFTVLHHAAHCGNAEATRILLSHGANVNARDSTGWTSLHSACLQGHTDVARLLISAGAHINARDSEGDTPLSDALRMKQMATARFLQQHGAVK